MKRTGLVKTVFIVGGIVELLIAIQHFTWPFQLVAYGEYAMLSQPYNDLLLLLAQTVGLLILAFSLLTFYFSHLITAIPKTVRVFGYMKGFVWFGRAMMEIALPVKLPIFFVNNPTVFILPAALLLSLLYIISMTLFRIGTDR